jgi:hypothetical protein
MKRRQTDSMSARVRKGPRPWRRRLLQVVGGLLVLVVLAVLGVVWRLHQGPIRIDFLQHRIEQALNELIAPVTVELGGTTLNWVGGGLPVQIRLANVRVLNPGGDQLASFDEIGVGLYPPALLRGKVIPTGLEVRRTSVVLERNEDGSFALGLADASPASGAEASPSLSEFLDQWVAPKDPDSPLGRLAEISVLESRVVVHDRMMGVGWGAEKVDASVKRQRTSLKAHVSLSLEVGDRESQVTADATYETTDSGLTAKVHEREGVVDEDVSRSDVPVQGAVAGSADLTRNDFLYGGGLGPLLDFFRYARYRRTRALEVRERAPGARAALEGAIPPRGARGVRDCRRGRAGSQL